MMMNYREESRVKKRVRDCSKQLKFSTEWPGKPHREGNFEVTVEEDEGASCAVFGRIALQLYGMTSTKALVGRVYLASLEKYHIGEGS